MAKSAGSWAKGQSGNPSGRRPGDPAIQRARRIIAAELPAIVAMLAELAKGGDVQAAKVLIDRILPVCRPDFEALEIRIAQLEERQ